MTISDEQGADKIHMTDGSRWNTAYGNIAINKKDFLNGFIFEWKLQTNGYGVYCIGIDSSNREHINTYFHDGVEEHTYYAWHGDGGLVSTKAEGGKNYAEVEYHNKSELQQNQVTMILNTKNQTLEYELNDKPIGIAFTDIDPTKEYYLAVCISGSTDVYIKLVHFKCR